MVFHLVIDAPAAVVVDATVLWIAQWYRWLTGGVYTHGAVCVQKWWTTVHQ